MAQTWKYSFRFHKSGEFLDSLSDSQLLMTLLVKISLQYVVTGIAVKLWKSEVHLGSSVMAGGTEPQSEL
jgi:hypothetical protein